MIGKGPRFNTDLEEEKMSLASSERLGLLRGDHYAIPLGKSLSLRVYVDSRPHDLEIARLQKGLVLAINGKELIEEGVGFGVPVAVFSDKTYFSGSAQVMIDNEGKNSVVVKRFFMDTVSKKGWKDGVFINDRIYKSFLGSLASLYRDYKGSRRFIFPLIKLRNKVGIRTLFTKVEQRGEVTVTYSIGQRVVNVKVDLSKLYKRNCEKVIILNEQGSTFFRRFRDSEGQNLTDEKIGPWDLVETNEACFSDLKDSLSFCLQSLPNCRLFRGSERIRGRLAWAGMGYELSPKREFFDYLIQIRLNKIGNV